MYILENYVMIIEASIKSLKIKVNSIGKVQRNRTFRMIRF